MSDENTDKSAGVEDQQALDTAQSTSPATKEEAEHQQALQELKQANKGDGKSIRVRVYSPFRDYYDGLAYSITAENQTGPFDILPKHHNFISLLTPCELVVRTVSEGDQHIRISGGLLHVKANEVIVFLDV